MAQPQLDAVYKLEDDAEPEPADVETLTTGVELTKSGRLSRKGGDTNVDYFKQLLLDAPGRFARTTAAQAPIRARAPVADVTSDKDSSSDDDSSDEDVPLAQLHPQAVPRGAR